MLPPPPSVVAVAGCGAVAAATAAAVKVGGEEAKVAPFSGETGIAGERKRAEELAVRPVCEPRLPCGRV